MAIGGQAFDTLVFDLTEASSVNPASGAGRLWFAPALGLFVREVWRSATSEGLTAFSVVDVSAEASGQ